MVIRCYDCGEPCTGEVLKVQDRHFHINCFKCHECGILLASGGYFPRNEHYYCSKDYHQLFGTQCRSCGGFVEGRVITALGHSYHPHCFICDRCGGEIRSGTVVTYNDKEEILCQKCSPDVSLSDTLEETTNSFAHTNSDRNFLSPSPSSMSNKQKNTGRPSIERSPTSSNSSLDESLDFAKVPDIEPETRKHMGKCAGCGDSIRTQQSVVALNRHWHLFCFTCHRCRKYLTTEYMHNNDHAYCEPCYQELYGMLCDNCEDFIKGPVLEAGDLHFHPRCAYCCQCGLMFGEGDDMCIGGENIWHLDCDGGVVRAGSHDSSKSSPVPENDMSATTTKPIPAEERRSTVRRQQSPAAVTQNVRPSSQQGRHTPDELLTKYPLKQLQLVGKMHLPREVNRTKLEKYLTDEDFFKVFLMDRNTFYSKPQWKQIELKKKANLF